MADFSREWVLKCFLIRTFLAPRKLYDYHLEPVKIFQPFGTFLSVISVCAVLPTGVTRGLIYKQGISLVFFLVFSVLNEI